MSLVSNSNDNFVLGFPTPIPPVCEAGLGLESYAIPDSSLTASTGNADNGRLHFFPKFRQNGGWVALSNNKESNWFQVDLGRWTKVTRISTQGRQDADQWVTNYRVSYSYDGIFFRDYKDNAGDAKVFIQGLKFNPHLSIAHFTGPRVLMRALLELYGATLHCCCRGIFHY